MTGRRALGAATAGSVVAVLATVVLAADQITKFLAIAGPSGVSTDSGWNWTPSIGYSRCLTPITSPSSVRAVISSSSGSRVAASEW